jgi:rhodanese-related sulfurtransferase
MALKKGFKELVAEAAARIESIDINGVAALLGRADVLFVDLRDVRELDREGMIPGAFHMPRGMLEFWIDPESPYYKDVFTGEKTYVFYCNVDWRSALATDRASEMGLGDVRSMTGGFTAWKEAGHPVGEHTREGR